MGGNHKQYLIATHPRNHLDCFGWGVLSPLIGSVDNHLFNTFKKWEQNLKNVHPANSIR